MFEVDFTIQAERDLLSIQRFLVEAYRAFGRTREDAVSLAIERTRSVRDAAAALGRAPHQGTLRPHLGEGVRSVTKGRAIFYFDVREAERVVRVLAIFYGGRDHQRAMLRRLLGDG